ncbi:SDR family NAD(P)-dependent oxidoreductase [Zhongshania aquimaris]|uniref:SDR family oxidoreductase n=1 Tax=Zhongshania aquimaris TaxID=2857107 RepID=A0ABS6VV67_9GAMM|nr:SDR family oxidoreductase [Zhongshania aquimaris]MBW2942181.1 SDR family oxidoreductase [Zhongshania aquimaris]
MLYQSPLTPVVVTGAAQGIGRACAEALAEAGRAIAIWDLNESGARSAAEDLKKEYGVATFSLALDTTDTAALGSAVEATKRALGSIGGLVHAAGISIEESLGDLTEENWDKVQSVNLRSYPFIVKALMEEFSHNAGSSVVGIASINTDFGNGNTPAYSVSKAGIISLTKSLAHTLGEKAIRINAVSPGYIQTAMSDQAFERFPELKEKLVGSTFLHRMGRPSEIASTVRFLLSNEASYITGQTIVIDGGATLSQF